MWPVFGLWGLLLTRKPEKVAVGGLESPDPEHNHTMTSKPVSF